MNRMRQLFQQGDAGSLTPVTIDEEAARRAPDAPAKPPAASSSTTTSGAGAGATGAKQLDVHAQLQAYRQMVGITAEPESTASKTRAAPNVGMYSQVVAAEKSAKRGYMAFAWVINACLGLQVIVAAALTAMGAASANHTTITAFGGINTAIAGFHTYLSGKGLPGRLKNYESAWAKVRQLIEEYERDFSAAAVFGAALPNSLSLEKAIADVEGLFNDTLTEVLSNQPDHYTKSAAKNIKASAQAPAQQHLQTQTHQQSHQQQLAPAHGVVAHPPSSLPRRQDVHSWGGDTEHGSLQVPEKAHTPSTPDAGHSAEHEDKVASSGEAST